MKDTDLTQLNEHRNHGLKMFKLMKNHQEQVVAELAEESESEDDKTDEEKQDNQKNDTYKVQYLFRRYPKTKLFNETDILDDSQCNVLNQETKAS